MHTAGYHIHFWGITQGIGFRPFLKRLADHYRLAGEVWNAADGVHLELIGERNVVERWLENVLQESPPGAFIAGHDLQPANCAYRQEFKIVASKLNDPPTALIPPDVAICTECRAEMLDPQNRRYGYPFITCTYCGPRYSILETLPYDRERTSMQAFTPCTACTEEYNDPADRRFHSQTNSCPDCGPALELQSDLPRQQMEIIDQSVQWLQAGKIGAVKGVAGYLLIVDATNAAAIQSLRKRKERPAKPLAVMYPDLAEIQHDFALPEVAQTALRSAVGPIVLLSPKQGHKTKLALPDLAPGLAEIGVMLPAAPLLQLISTAVGRPLVATSANISGSPILATKEAVAEQLGTVADFFLHHNRAVLNPQDDSVLRFSQLRQRPIWLRRARGLAPLYQADCTGIDDGHALLAFGADLKHSFCLRQHGNTLLSPYLGDLSGYESQVRARNCLQRLMGTSAGRKLKNDPAANEPPFQILADMHPAYHSTAIAEELSRQTTWPLQKVQHHQAHFAALVAEHGWKEIPEDTLGVIWDGTGYGDDGQVWGGEFFQSRSGAIERVAQLTYFPVLLGDKMSLEPRLSALSLFGPDPALKSMFSEQEWQLYSALLDQRPTLRTSSMGRLFDAVAAVLGLVEGAVSYEGEAALRLEHCARTHQLHTGWPKSDETPWPVDDLRCAQAWLPLLLREHQQGQAVAESAFKFHRQCIAMIRQVASTSGCARLAFSGGVWQNSLLVDLADHLLGRDYELLFHREQSPNDENISYGQIALTMSQATSPAALTTSSTIY